MADKKRKRTARLDEAYRAAENSQRAQRRLRADPDMRAAKNARGALISEYTTNCGPPRMRDTPPFAGTLPRRPLRISDTARVERMQGPCLAGR